MADIEKVLETLQKALDNAEIDGTIYAEIRRPVVFDVIQLLKEQGETINNLTDTIQQLNQHIKDLSEYMTPYGMIKDVKVYAEQLKEQEAVEPKQVGLYGNDEWWGVVCVCPDCKAEWMSEKADTHFCPKCGQAVKWE